MTDRIRITKVQADAVEWALGAMEEYWRDHDAEGITENEPDCVPETWTMPRVEGDWLILSDWRPVNEDLAYRVGEQLADMAEDNSVMGDVHGTTFFSLQKSRALIRSYGVLAKRINNAVTIRAGRQNLGE